ncbi:MAG: 4-alpha-glucanotransferase [Clostridia bacterium]
MQRQAGVLLPISALRGGWGIGDFGKGADTFIQLISDMGFSVWQVLPITLIGEGNSPYSGESSYAGNYALIDIEALHERLLSRKEKEESLYQGSPYKVDYDFALATKKRLLKLAFSRINSDDRVKINAFLKKNMKWLSSYATYMAIKEESGTGFLNWSEGLKQRDTQALKAAQSRLSSEIAYYYFEQTIFYQQWENLKNRAAVAGVKIFGDLPVYVALESVEVWAEPEVFALDTNFTPKKVAGVPPDYFAEDGQLWGNPIYNYKRMKEDGYSWWTDRLLHNLKLYDILRIDHFRGLSEYWAVPAGAKTAKLGKWEKAPGMAIWKALNKLTDNPPIVAEDLGSIDEKVVRLLEKTGFPGMRVLQFGFDGNRANPHLPYNYPINSVAYTATHDNNTTLGWLYELDSATREGVLNFLDVKGDWGQGGGLAPAVIAAIKAVMQSSAKLAIIPFQDLCGYGADARINIPGVAKGNWEYRITQTAIDEIAIPTILSINRKYGRTMR